VAWPEGVKVWRICAPFLRLRLRAYTSIAPRPAILERTHTCTILSLLPATAIEIVSVSAYAAVNFETRWKVRVVTRPAQSRPGGNMKGNRAWDPPGARCNSSISRKLIFRIDPLVGGGENRIGWTFAWEEWLRCGWDVSLRRTEAYCRTSEYPRAHQTAADEHSSHANNRTTLDGNFKGGTDVQG
jgi:hypothetical protein